MLQDAGIQFRMLEKKGISVVDFAELLMVSVLVVTEDVT